MSDQVKGKTPPKELASLLGILAALTPPGMAPMNGLDFGPNPFDGNGFRKPGFMENELKNFMPPLPNRPPDLMVIHETIVHQTSETLTRKDLMHDLLPTYASAIVLAAEEIAMGQIGPKNYVLRNKTDEELIADWKRIVSPGYFKQNPTIEDVLLDKGFGGKVWVASRPKVR